ncbi:TPA: hypothetical protein ACF2U2_004788 [Escherichia coli]|jgi:hypothetical protein|nr:MULTISPECIES: hypothetical protein [Enterobacteriaceae]MEC9850213.1 hypothetical protein [Escherichia marmotae]MCF2060219.1 hypothetical protein [Escherichia coli]MCF6492332.1 hypothetical protein [Escherichia coli]MCH4779392.1 hypothetical protein [Escherichia coli]MCH6254784.1 hypothetical protein [Escherichia coli]
MKQHAAIIGRISSALRKALQTNSASAVNERAEPIIRREYKSTRARDNTICPAGE